MNLGQTMITMGMFVLLVMSVISANRMLLQNTEVNLQTEALNESAIIANDFFQEALGKKFDAHADSSGTQGPFEFSSPSGGTPGDWGPSSEESSAVGALPDSSYLANYRSKLAYNDVDDYRGYTRIVSADTSGGIRIGGFLVTVRVFYVTSTYPDIAVNYQTNFKKIEVDVEHPQYLQKVTYTSLMSY